VPPEDYVLAAGRAFWCSPPNGEET